VSPPATGLAPHSFYQDATPGHRPRTHDDGVSLDSFVNWLIDAGYPLQRIDDYDDWLSRLETALRGLPQVQRDRSLLALMDAYRHPAPALASTVVPADRFRTAVRDAGIGPDHDIPHLSAPFIVKYLADLQHLELL
jgi:fatty acid CoA ligase FadD9